jgi:hypothetical protein
MKATTAANLTQLKAKKIPAVQYKGFTIIYINGYFRANAYANPSFEEKNKSILIKNINAYLKS